MTSLHIRALWHLLRFESFLSRGDFASLYRTVRHYPCSSASPTAGFVDEICRAVDLLCIFYPKQVLCLQRSAATTCLLKHYGVRAQMVIGAQQMPFKAHAWVEVEDRVANDKPYTPQMYPVVDRC